MKKKVLLISLNQEQLNYLRAKAASNDVSMSQIARELINKDMKGDK